MQRKNEDTTKKLQNNLADAEKSIIYARKHIPVEGSSTHPDNKNKQLIDTLFNSIEKNVRNKKLTETHFLRAFLLICADLYYKTSVRPTHTAGKIHGKGNCDELSDIVAYFLKNQNVSRIEKVSIVDSDHVFIIMDRNMNSKDINDFSSWGEFCVVVDPLNQCNYPATEIFTQLKAYTLDMTKDDPHVVSDFSKERRLKVMAEFCCKNEPVLNKHLIDQFIGNMLVLQEAFNMFSNVNDIEKFSQAMMNVKEKIMTLDLEQATNFAIEKHLDKINKEILLALKEMSGTNYDKIFNAIILKMRSQYTSFTHYATDIINLNEETFYHLLDQIYRNSDQDKHYQALKNELENHDNFDAVLNDAWKNNKPIAIASLLRCLSMFDPDAALSIKKEVFEWGLQKDHKQLVNGLLVELNNEVDEGGEIYFSPLHIAVRQGKPEIIKEIFTQYRELAKECFASRFNRNGETMLHIAVDGGNNSLVKSLLSCLGSCAAFVNQQRHDGCTPLHLAVSKGKIEMVKALLEQGADPRIANRKNHTSLSIAKSKGNYEIMNLLNNAINTNTAKPNPNRHF